jgi:hypothetical protein
MLPFALNTFAFTQSSDMVEKDLAKTLLPAQRDAITTVKCHPRLLIFDFSSLRSRPEANKHCLHTFRALKGLERVILAMSGIRMEAVYQGDLKLKLEEMYEGVEILLEGTMLPHKKLGMRGLWF